MPIRHTVTLPDLSHRGARRGVNHALDRGLSEHRRRALPRHFTKRAYSWYPAAYANNYKLFTKNKKDAAMPPLVKSGKLERIVTVGGPQTFSGPPNFRHMTIHNLPNYAYIDKGAFKKIPAMQAVASFELQSFATTVDRDMQQNFLDKTTTKRS